MANALKMHVCLPRELITHDAIAVEREWLVTNGIGGYACSTLANLTTRRYHGLLVAALKPPLGRTLLWSRLEETVRYQNSLFTLHTNQWTHAAADPYPTGYHYLDSFHLEGTTPVWTFRIQDARLEKRIWMQPGANTSYVRYDLLCAGAPFELAIKAFVNHRDFHRTTRVQDWHMKIDPVPAGLRVLAFEDAQPFYLFASSAELRLQHTWYRNHFLSQEQARGLDALDDALYVADFKRTLQPGEQLTLLGSTLPDPEGDGRRAYSIRRTYEQNLQARCSWADAPDWIDQLVLAADQFLVDRPLGEHETGRTIIAGYPWFGDWGRDTMIALPGLALATGREQEAMQVLRTFARYVDQGMLPNRWPADNALAEYNTVDAGLWYFEALWAVFQATGNVDLISDLFPTLAEILDWYCKGTRFGIRRDPADGLLAAGQPGVQLTWMDARVDTWVVTPRIGKPVEVNALWFNALKLMAELAPLLGKSAADYLRLAEQAAEGFQRFWSDDLGYCLDVLDGPEGDEALLRPNQLFAISLTHSPLNPEQQKAVLDVCARRLLTPLGLNSLAPDQPGFQGKYQGGLQQRDGAYHQGTVWTWLIGPFTAAHFKVYGDAQQARAYLEAFAGHLLDACVGSISEIADGDPPHRPRGAIAQAWSVAELLRLWQLTQNPPHKSQQ